jgi:hypothetical protein
MSSFPSYTCGSATQPRRSPRGWQAQVGVRPRADFTYCHGSQTSTGIRHRVAHGQPSVVVILDDIHVGDEPSLLVLRHLAEQIANARLLVFATFRDVEPAMGANTPVSDSPMLDLR